MSALIIIAHVKEGVDLALKHRLNQRIIDIIQEHHGTSLVYYFYKRALQQQEDARTGGKIMNLVAILIAYPIIISVLEAYGIPIVGHAEMEADDVIGTLATGAGMPVDVVTGDRDLFQLVDDEADVRVLYIARGVGNHERVTNEWVRNKYDVDARQYADFATLRGDASDGLPGVAGVGEKTAATLLNRFGDMDGILAAATDPDADMGPGPRGKIRAAAAYLEVAPSVVAVARNIELGVPDTTLPSTPRDPARLEEIASRWGIESPVQRLLGVLGGNGTQYRRPVAAHPIERPPASQVTEADRGSAGGLDVCQAVPRPAMHFPTSRACDRQSRVRSLTVVVEMQPRHSPAAHVQLTNH